MMNIDDIDKLDVFDDVKNDIKFVESELNKIDDPLKKIEFIHEYIETYEWSHHIKKSLTDKYWTDYAEISHTPDTSMDTIKKKIYDSEPEARKRCEQAIDKAGGYIEYFKIRCPNYHKIEYKQFPPPIEKLKYLAQRVDDLSNKVKPISNKPASLFPGLVVINLKEFLQHLHDAETKGILRYEEGGKIILAKTGHHNCLAVALYVYWLDAGLVSDEIKNPWEVLSDIIVLPTLNSRGEYKKLNRKKLWDVHKEKKFIPQLDFLNDIF